jgi:hypothetical protein
MEEKFSAAKFGSIILGLLLISVLGGSLFVAIKGSQSSTQSWLNWVSIVFSIVLFAFMPLMMRKL